MKKITITLLRIVTFLAISSPALAIDIWAVAETNINTTIGCRDTIWFKMWSPIPTLENNRGKVVIVTEHLENGKIINFPIPENLTPHPDADVWLSDDRYTIYVVIKNLKVLSLDWTNGKGEYNGPYYGIQIFDRFTPKKDNSPDELIFKYFDMRYVVSQVRYQTGVEEDLQTIVSKKIGTRTYLPFYVSHLREDSNNIEFKERLLDVETKYSVFADRIFDDKKFLHWDMKGKQIDDIEFSNPNPKSPNSLDFTIHCGAITDGIDLTLTPIYTKPLSKWKLTVTTDSTIRHLGGTHYYPTQQWETDTDWGRSRVEVGYDTAKVGYDTTLHFSLLKDSSDYFYTYLVSSTTDTQGGLPMRIISNVPEFNFIGNGDPHILKSRFYYPTGYDSVHIHFTRSAVNSVEENVPEAGLQQLQWQTTSERDILLKTPPLWGEGQVELYTIVGTMIQQFDVNTLSRSSEGMLLPTAGIPSGAYIVLVKSKNYRSGTVLQIIR